MKTPYDRNKKLSYQIMFWCFIGIIAMLIILASCEKVEDEYCWNCTIYFYERKYMDDGRIFERRYADSLQQCGFTERDIQKYERYRTVEKYNISTCGDHIRWQEYVCIKQD